MPITQHADCPALPSSYKKKLEEELDNQSFKGVSGSIQFSQPDKAKPLKLSKINMGQGKDIFIKWEGDNLMVYGFTEKHGSNNKTYEGYLMGKKLQTIVIK